MGLNIQFQFHKGTIKPTLIIAVTGLAINFNSIKVRLNHLKLLEINPIIPFQFHKGTIKPDMQSVGRQLDGISIP